MRLFLIISLSVAASLLLLTGCLDPYEVISEGGEGLLVVEGRITDGNGPHVIRLGLTVSGGARPPIPLATARVLLTDEQGRQEELVNQGDGSYLHYGGVVQGSPGGSYQLEIFLEDGRQYRSRPESILPVPPITNVAYEFQRQEYLDNDGIRKERFFVRAFIDTDIPEAESGPYLRWETEESFKVSELNRPWDPLFFPKFCYVTQPVNPQRITLFDGDRTQPGPWQGQLVAERLVDETFSEKHYLNIYQRSLSRDALRFWQQANQIANPSGTIFDVPPAPLRGNLFNVNDEQEAVLGYFEATAIDTARIVIFPNEIPFFFPKRCEGGVFISIPEPCFNCLAYPGATLERPDYF